jgi:hypothetical protein
MGQFTITLPPSPWHANEPFSPPSRPSMMVRNDCFRAVSCASLILESVRAPSVDTFKQKLQSEACKYFLGQKF